MKTIALKKLMMIALALVVALSATAMADDAVAPRYVFMFIGDGMGTPQVTAAQYYLGSIGNPDPESPAPADLSFTGFPCLGMIMTYNASSFCPDSASNATAMASGEKTRSGVINYDANWETTLKPITEYAKEAGMKVGVITSVSLDNATPAAYYARVSSREKYYDIAVQGLTGTTLDYLAGGSFSKPDGDGTQENLFDLAAQNGWTLVNTNEAIRALNGESGRVLAIDPYIAGSQSLPYEIDRKRKVAYGMDILSLADYVNAGIRVLDNENGFFMMCEGGKIDLACHSNDAATSIHETIAFSDAVQVAVDFAAEHPDETLIIVTADHETGGMTLGFAATAYDMHFPYLANQLVSCERFDWEIEQMREQNATFEDAMAQVERYYGLTLTPDQPLSLTKIEVDALRAAFELSMMPKEQRALSEIDALLYGGYEPFLMTVSHIMNNKAGLSFTSYAHTGLQIPVYAMGVGAERFSGLYDNTGIFERTMDVMGLSR
ncbi:MAG: alkaline phosphatase [Candidatus Fimadaptatus sp.]